MAVDQRRRQQKLARKAQKDKTRRKELNRKRNEGIVAKLQRCPLATFLPILASGRQGMHSLIVARQISATELVTAGFLVDRYCLGIKDAWVYLGGREQYEKTQKHLRQEGELEYWQPEQACKFVLGAVNYARQLGLAPHPGWDKAKAIFLGVEPGKWNGEFEYGENGKPHFISGPHDSGEKCRFILNVLTKTCGPDNFYFTILDDGSLGLAGLGLDAAEEDGDFEDDDL